MSEEMGVKYMQKWEESEESIRPYYEAIAALPDKTAEDVVKNILETCHED